jgi:AcrR family transcriptional regulator
LVSVRDIAAEADVTLGLVHHYYESKEALVAATLRSIATDIDQVAADGLTSTGDRGEMVRAVWRFLQERPAFPFIVSWWLLEGRNVTEAMGDHPFLQRLVASLGGAGDADGATLAGVVIAQLLGGTVLRVGINRALGRPIDDHALIDRMESVVVDTALTNRR